MRVNALTAALSYLCHWKIKPEISKKQITWVVHILCFSAWYFVHALHLWSGYANEFSSALVLQCQNVLIFKFEFLKDGQEEKSRNKEVETVELVLSSPFYCYSGLCFLALSAVEHFLNKEHYTVVPCSFFLKSRTAKPPFDKREFPWSEYSK